MKGLERYLFREEEVVRGPEGKREEPEKGEGRRKRRKGRQGPGSPRLEILGRERCGGTPRRARPLAAAPRQSPAAQALKPRPSLVRRLAPASFLSRGLFVPVAVRGRKVYVDGLCRRWARGESGSPGASGCTSLLVELQEKGSGVGNDAEPAPGLPAAPRGLCGASSGPCSRPRLAR